MPHFVGPMRAKRKSLSRNIRGDEADVLVLAAAAPVNRRTGGQLWEKTISPVCYFLSFREEKEENWTNSPSVLTTREEKTVEQFSRKFALCSYC